MSCLPAMTLFTEPDSVGSSDQQADAAISEFG